MPLAFSTMRRFATRARTQAGGGGGAAFGGGGRAQAGSGGGTNLNWDASWDVKAQRHRDRLVGGVPHSAPLASLRSAAAVLGPQFLP